MLATDIQPNRLTRAKLAAQDLITRLTGDRAGLVAFAGSAFLEAPLTVDYDAVLTALNDLDVDTIPLGGTNLAAAIDLAVTAFGKAEGANHAIVLMSDGEATAGEAGDALKAAARANDAGIKIFTVGLGTPEGSLIPLGDGQFVKDHEDKIVRTKIDEPGLDKIAKAAGGFYLHLQNGPAEMRSLAQDGLGKMKAGDIDAKVNRKPIERYQWPLGFALLCLTVAALIGERRRARANVPAPVKPRALATAAALLLVCVWAAPTRAADAPSEPMNLYRDGKYDEAYQGFSDLAKKHDDAPKLEFDAGASAFRGKKYDAAMDAFGRAMTSDDPILQAKAHYNIGNTLFEHGLAAQDSQAKVKDWRNAIQHYNNAIGLAKGPPNQPLAANAVYNRDLVQKAIDDELKPKPTPPPKPSPSPTPPPDKGKDKDNNQSQDKQQGKGDDKNDNDQSQGGQGGQGQDKGDSQNSPPKPDSSGDARSQDSGDKGQASPSPSQDQNSPPQGGNQGDQGKQGSQGDQQPGNTPPPEQQPRQRGDFQAQQGDKPPEQGDKAAGELNKEADAPEEKGKMSAAQARALLDALKNEDQNPILENRKKNPDDPAVNDW